MLNRNKTSKILTDKTNTRYFSNLVFPDIPVSVDDTYVITTDQDRYDLLAKAFYGDSSLWWIIPAANNITARDSMYPTPGIQLRIPADKNFVINIFEEENQNR